MKREGAAKRWKRWMIQEEGTNLYARSCGRVLEFLSEREAQVMADQWTNATAHMGGHWSPVAITDVGTLDRIREEI